MKEPKQDIWTCPQFANTEEAQAAFDKWSAVRHDVARDGEATAADRERMAAITGNAELIRAWYFDV